MLAPDRVKGDVLAHGAVGDELDATIRKLLNSLHDYRLFQLEARNAIGQQPARAVIAIIDRDLHALPPQHVRRRKTPRPRADDADAFGPFGMGADRLDPAFLPRRIGDVFLHRADGDCAMARLFDHAVAFAQPILRADAAADFREGVGGLAYLVGFLQPPLGGQLQPVGDVVVQGAMRLAIGHAALAAAAGLLGRLAIRVLPVNLVEILRARGCVTFLGHLFAQGDEFQHLLRGHGPPPNEFFRERLDTVGQIAIKVSMVYLFAGFSADETGKLPFFRVNRSAHVPKLPRTPRKAPESRRCRR